jgi:hypothetical protein
LVCIRAIPAKRSYQMATLKHISSLLPKILLPILAVSFLVFMCYYIYSSILEPNHAALFFKMLPISSLLLFNFFLFFLFIGVYVYITIVFPSWNHQVATKILDYLYVGCALLGLSYAVSNTDQVVPYYISRFGDEDKLIREIKEAARIEVKACDKAWLSETRASCEQISEIMKTENFTVKDAMRMIDDTPQPYEFIHIPSNLTHQKMMELIYIDNVKAKYTPDKTFKGMLFGFALLSVSLCLRLLKTSIELVNMFPK